MSIGRSRPRAVASVVVTGLVAAGLAATGVGTAQAAPTHEENPYAGAAMYVNRYWSDAVMASARAATNPGLQAATLQLATQSTGVWMERIAAIDGNGIDSPEGPGLRWHLDEALKQVDGKPVVVNVVIYDLPGRDCAANASNGELPATAAGLARYEADYIDPIADILADPAYEELRIVTIVEPDSLGNIVTNLYTEHPKSGAVTGTQECTDAEVYYRDGVAYALDALHDITNVYTYLDGTQAGWMGWDVNLRDLATVFGEVAQTTTDGYASIDGFVTNVSGYVPSEEPFLPDAEAPKLPSGNFSLPPLRARFYEWNKQLDETDYTAALYTRLTVKEGFPTSIGMLIDSGRNGWGGTARPTAVSANTTDLNTYVNESRVDRRQHRGAWCNPRGAGLGIRPTADTAVTGAYPDSHLDAFVWIKPPGESDGNFSWANVGAGTNDPMCNPFGWEHSLADADDPDDDYAYRTAASMHAPLAGHWFDEQFNELVTNAYPPIVDGEAPVVPGFSTELPKDDGCAAALAVSTSWPGGFNADVTVTATDAAITQWSTTFTLPDGAWEVHGWNGSFVTVRFVVSRFEGVTTVTNLSYNGSLNAGQSTTYGFTGGGTAPTGPVEVTCTVN